jgi:hypothetical protein
MRESDPWGAGKVRSGLGIAGVHDGHIYTILNNRFQSAAYLRSRSFFGIPLFADVVVEACAENQMQFAIPPIMSITTATARGCWDARK